MTDEQVMPLYNLDVGPQLVREQQEAVAIGPFSIRFVQDYETKVTTLTQPAQLQSNMQLGGGKLVVEETKREPAYAQDWICTAHAVHDGTDETSVLAASPIDDGGLWDLCELLTFFTGRRVTAEPYKIRHGAAYRHVGRGMKVFYQAIHAVAHAWPNRLNFVEKSLEMAMLSQNQAVFDMIQTQASHYTTALDIVCAKYKPQVSAAAQGVKLDRKTKSSLKEKVGQAINDFDGLTDSQKQSYVRIVSARIDQGLAKGFVAKLEDVLADFGAVDVPVGDEVRERVRFIDRIRNAIIHIGRLPSPAKGESEKAVGQRVAMIVSDVIPEINCQAFYRELGFTEDDRRKFCLDTATLRDFFTQGSLGPTLEDISDLRVLERVFGEAEIDDDNDG